jgi:hypothetical protein
MQTFEIAKTPFSINYVVDGDGGDNNNDTKTIEILYSLTNKNSETIGILRVLNRLINSVYDGKFYEWINTSIELDSGYIHFLTSEQQVKQNQWISWNNDTMASYHGTGYGSLQGNNYSIEIHFDQGVPSKMNVVKK